MSFFLPRGFNTVAAESSSDPTVSELEQYKNIFEGAQGWVWC
jgi:hypothetical protein